MLDSFEHIIIKKLPPSTDRAPLFVVGDVHGCALELAQLIEKAKQSVRHFQLVLVGDLFTKGPDPIGVFQLIQEYKAICIKGNHDWALSFAMKRTNKTGNRPLAEHTQQTLFLIRHHRKSIASLLAGLPHALKTTIVPSLKRPLWEKEYPVVIVHAGIDPSRGVEHTTERLLLTARFVKWEHSHSGKRLVPVSSLIVQGTPLLPDNEQKTEKFRWHEIHQGPELIVFGHDAKQGLFRKTLPTGRPICVGLDTGCTYGGSLTGYFPEIDIAVQVRAARQYFDMQKNTISLNLKQQRR